MKGLEHRMSLLEKNFNTLHTSVTDVLARQPRECSAIEAFAASAVELFGKEMGGRISELASEHSPDNFDLATCVQ